MQVDLFTVLSFWFYPFLKSLNWKFKVLSKLKIRKKRYAECHMSYSFSRVHFAHFLRWGTDRKPSPIPHFQTVLAVPVTHQQKSKMWSLYTLIISEHSCELSWTELMVNLLPLCVAWHSLDMTQPLSPRELWELLMEHFGYLIKMWTLKAAKILFWPTTACSQCQTQLGNTDSTRSWHYRYWPGLRWVSVNYSPSFIPLL